MAECGRALQCGLEPPEQIDYQRGRLGAAVAVALRSRSVLLLRSIANVGSHEIEMLVVRMLAIS